MSVRIISDSACDISQLEAKELGITVLPLKTYIDGVEYLDGVNLTTEEFYKKLETCHDLPTTSQLTPIDLDKAFRPIVENGDTVVMVSLASKMSGTAQSAVVAAANYPGRVFVVDSDSATIGQRTIVLYAARLCREGLPAEEIVARLEREKKRLYMLARVDTLENLVRGGRISKTAGIAGTLLHIKPIVCLDEGVIKVVGKPRGYRQSDNMLTELIQQKGGIDFSMPVVVGYSGTDGSLLREYLESSHAMWEGHSDITEKPVLVGSASSTYTGPGAIAVGFFANRTGTSE